MLLRAEGYDVLTASCLTEAQEIARRNSSIKLLLTEQHLSNCESGSQAIASLREILGADMKAVLITDDMVSAATNMLKLDPRVRVARKPLHADELLRLLAQ